MTAATVTIEQVQDQKPVARLEATPEGRIRVTGPKRTSAEADAEYAALDLASDVDPDDVTAEAVLRKVLERSPARYREAVQPEAQATEPTPPAA